MHTTLQSCKSKKQHLEKGSLQFLVHDYLHKWGNSYHLEDQWWGDKELTWEAAITRAWKSRLKNGVMHGHQRRVAKKLSQGLEIALADSLNPKDFKDFESLYDWVKSVVDRVKGLGLTTAYDVARRLGAWLELEPSLVYLHAGTAIGARKFGIDGEVAALSAFPNEIQVLGATHLENFLCIYKDKLSCSVVPYRSAADS